MNLLIRHWEEIFQQKSRTFFWNRGHTLELLLFRFINRANWIGIVHCWSRSRRDSSSLWAAARLFKTTWFCKWKTTVVCTLKATHSPGMRCSSSYWKAKPTRWTLLRGISHLWQRQPAFARRSSPALRPSNNFADTKTPKTSAVELNRRMCTCFSSLLLAFVSLVRFLCFRYSSRLQSSWQYFRSPSLSRNSKAFGLNHSRRPLPLGGGGGV